MFKVIGKSLFKALKDTGRVAGSAAAVAGLLVLADPVQMAAAWAVIGPAAPFAVLAINFGARAGLDALKHRDKA